MADGRSRSLTRREFDAVIRRAAELASSEVESVEGSLSEAELFRIAGEVGLPEAHIRRALTEVRSSGPDAGVLDRVFGPSSIRAARVVPGVPDVLSEEIDEFLVASQLLQSVRRTPGLLQYRPAVDWASQIARAASFTSRKYYVASAKSVEVTLERVDEKRTFVEFLVDPGTRGEDIAGAVIGGGAAGTATGVATGLAISTAAPLVLATGVGVALGLGVWSGIGFAVGRGHKRKVEEVRIEVEGILDALELGDSLEPPPSSWRRWVKRHFHGVARDLVDRDDDRK